MKVLSAPSGSHVTALAVGPAAGPGAETSAGRWHRSSTKYPTGAMRWMRRGTGGHEWDYRYTVDGERVVTRQKRAVGDEILTYTLRDLEGKPLRTYRNANGTWLWEKDYVYRGRLLLATAAPAIGVRHVHVDHLGTPRFFTDRGKREAGYHALFPFGEESPDKPSATAGVPLSTQWDSERLRFTGHERDLQATLDAPADDLDYMHARYYNPNLGRFLSVDPGSPSPALPQSWNRFSYASNSPTSQVDRDGRLANWAIGAIAGAVIGGVGEAVRQAIAGDPVNFRDIGAAAAGGLISGAIAGGTFGASLVVEFGVGGAVVAGAVANTAGGVVQRELDSSEATSGLSGKAMMVDAVVGGVGGGAGHTVENAARTMASGEARALQASVARRQQIVDARTASNTPPMSAAQKLARDKAALAAIETRAVTKGVVVGTTTTNAAAPILVMQIPDSSTKAPGP